MPEQNVVEILNRILGQKAFVRKASTKTVRVKTCEVDPPFVPIHGGIHCWWENRQESCVISAPATVNNTRVVKLIEYSFDTLNFTSLPEQIHITKKQVLNPSSSTVTAGVTLSVTGNKSWSFQKSQGISTTSGGSMNLSLSVKGLGSAGTTCSWSSSISTSSSVAEGESASVTRTVSDSVSIKPFTGVSIEMLAFESSAVFKFKARVVVDADLDSNLSNINLASQILSEEERTFEISGDLKICEVSNEFLTVKEIPVEKPADSTKSAVFQTDENLSLFGTVNNLFLTDIILKNNRRKDSASEAASYFVSDESGSSIGPADGLVYEILYTTEVYEPSPICGFNDLGLMNTAVFTEEHRRYSQYQQGTLVSQWDEAVKTFGSCFIP